MNWKEYQKAFAWDGSWRDIYVLHTNLHDWQKLIEFLRRRDFRLKYLLDGVDASLPDSVEHIFKQRAEISPLLSIDVKVVILNCHFFWEEEIEFDIDPREVKEERDAEGLFDFMSEVGRFLEKDVILTPENMQEVVLFRFNSKANKIECEDVELP